MARRKPPLKPHPRIWIAALSPSTLEWAAEHGYPVLLWYSRSLARGGSPGGAGPRRSWVIQFCQGETRHRETGRLSDDRLLVAKEGVPLEKPYREHELDLSEIARAAAKGQRR
jgi:alkanesulfonate monooxygenase SsuD/methylene tetrahydromethanopterin reductase-like flavin-dependent oxidoreductase (luciferase family)